MSFTPHDAETVLDIFNAARRIQTYAGELERERFDHDQKTQDAVLRQILVIGEATKRLSAAFRRAHPAMAWARMAGMCDVVVHGYDEIDIEMVWDVVVRDAPRLIAYLERLLPPPPEA